MTDFPNHPEAPDPDDALIVGDGIVLARGANGEFVLHAVSSNGMVALGTFGDIRSAWRAMDDLDDDVAGLAKRIP